MSNGVSDPKAAVPLAFAGDVDQNKTRNTITTHTVSSIYSFSSSWFFVFSYFRCRRDLFRLNEQAVHDFEPLPATINELAIAVHRREGLAFWT